MHVIKTEQIALITIVFVVALASTLSRSMRDGDRRSHWRLFGLGSTSGFLAVGLYCIGAFHAHQYFGDWANLFWIGVAAFVGFTAQVQDKIGSELFVAAINKVLGMTITSLSAIKSVTSKKDEPKE